MLALATCLQLFFLRLLSKLLVSSNLMKSMARVLLKMLTLLG